MKNSLKITTLMLLFYASAQCLFGQYEFDYFDSETIGAKGIYDRQVNLFVSTGGTKKVCSGGKDIYYAYVLRSQGSMAGSAIYIGDGENDYIGTDIKKLDNNRYYVVGYTTRAQTFPGIWDLNTSTLTRYYNAFIALVDFDSTNLEWIRVIGNPNTNDKALAVTVDEDGAAWVTGIADELAPCKLNSNQNCSHDCYTTGNVLFANFDQYGVGAIISRLGLTAKNWAQGNDIYYANGQLYIASVISDASCCSGNNSSASIISYDPSTFMFNNVYLAYSTGINSAGTGLYADFSGGMYMVGDLTSRGDGFLWNFSNNLTTQSINTFHCNSTQYNYNDWNFKAIVSDSFCHGLDTTGHGNDSLYYSRQIVITGDANTAIAPFSNMFALNIDPASLTRFGTTNSEFSAYINNYYSKNANIAAVYDSCNAIDSGNHPLYAVFGFSHDPIFQNKTSYITGVDINLSSGCNIKDSFYYFIDSIPEDFTQVQQDYMDVLDSFYNESSGMNELNLCEQPLVSPIISKTGNSKAANPTNKLSDKSELSIQPNPANNSVTILNNQAFTKAYVIIYDNTGKAVKRINIQDGKTNIEINTSNLMNGMYYFSIMNNGLLTTKKVVKQGE